MGIRADKDLHRSLDRIIAELDRCVDAGIEFTPELVRHLSATLRITRDAHHHLAEYEALMRDTLADELAKVTPLHSIRVGPRLRLKDGGNNVS